LMFSQRYLKPKLRKDAWPTRLLHTDVQYINTRWTRA
jgi:hypothetical protein